MDLEPTKHTTGGCELLCGQPPYVVRHGCASLFTKPSNLNAPFICRLEALGSVPSATSLAPGRITHTKNCNLFSTATLIYTEAEASKWGEQKTVEIKNVCQTAHFSTCKNKNGGIRMKPKTKMSWRIVASLIVGVLALGTYVAFFATPRAVASLSLQVNPAVNLTLSGRNTIIDAEGLNAQGEELLAKIDVRGKEVQAALRLISGALHETGLLGPTQQVVVALHTIDDRLTASELITQAGNVRQALLGYMNEQGLSVEVKVGVVTDELLAVAEALDLLPIDYVDLVAEVGHSQATEVLKLQKELGLDPILFKEELSTIGASLIDLVEAGIAENNALAILRLALLADPKLEELTTITAAMIDLHEVGATQADIMALFSLVEEQIAAGMDKTLLLEEITTLSAAKIDLLEADIPAAEAMAILKAAMAADPKLEELTTITAVMIDLTEKGLSKEEALAKVQAAIKADPTLKDFDDLVKTPETGEPQSDETKEPADASEEDKTNSGN